MTQVVWCTAIRRERGRAEEIPRWRWVGGLGMADLYVGEHGFSESEEEEEMDELNAPLSLYGYATK